MALSTIQQQLFSYFNLTNVSSLESLLKIFGEIRSKEGIVGAPTPEQLSQEILIINRTIQKYDFEILETVDEITCEKVFVLVNTSDNVISQKSKFYDENTSQLFSKIVRDCVLSYEGYLSETHCLNLSSQVKITKSAAQSVLEKLMADKWLVSVHHIHKYLDLIISQVAIFLQNNKISLGIRSIVELQQNIKQHYPDDVKNCPLCKLIVIQGCVCSNCEVKCHWSCWKKYFSMSKPNFVCPNCKEVWNDLPLEVSTEVSEQNAHSSFNISSPKRKKKKLSS